MEEVIIADLVTGDDYDFIILVADVPSGQTVVSGWLTIKRYDSDPDEDAVIQKNVGSSLTSAGIITTSGVYTNVTVQLTHHDTRLLNPVAEYEYDIAVLTSVNKKKTVEKGIIRPVQDITRI